MRNVLVVIRDEKLRKRVERLLPRRELHLQIARNVRELRMALRRPVDLLIADMNAAALDGVEVVRVVKRLNPEAKSMAISGSSLWESTAFQGLVAQLDMDSLLHASVSDDVLGRSLAILVEQTTPAIPPTLAHTA